MDESERDRFLAAAERVGDLALHPEVTRRWTDESACAGMSVGGLAFHLSSQVVNAVRLLEAPASELAPIPVWEHYRRAAWVNDDLDGPANVDIREASDEQAGEGPAALRDWLGAARERLGSVLAATPADRAVLIPWAGWALSAGDFLLTRTMEILVHSDDLAASVGLETPVFPEDVAAPVLALLTGLAVRRHGQAAVVRTLTRPQRAPSSVAAF